MHSSASDLKENNLLETFIGIDLGGTNLKAGLCDSNGRVLLKEILKTGTSDGRDRIIKDIVELVEALSTRAGEKTPVRALGMGVPGPVDFAHGVIHDLVNIPGWEEVPIRTIMEERTGIQCFVDNDVNVTTLGELRFGAASNCQNGICLTLGTGVGGGLILEGQLYRGTSFSAGELGHIIIVKDGPQCNCGNRGCLESFVGNRYLVERAVFRIQAGEPSLLSGPVREDPGGITPVSLQDAALNGDALACEIWKETGEYLGIVLAGLVNVFNPEIIVIGGGVAGAGDLLMEPVRRMVRACSMKVPGKAVSIVTTQLGIDAGIIGGAALAMEETAGKN